MQQTLFKWTLHYEVQHWRGSKPRLGLMNLEMQQVPMFSNVNLHGTRVNSDGAQNLD